MGETSVVQFVDERAVAEKRVEEENLSRESIEKGGRHSPRRGRRFQKLKIIDENGAAWLLRRTKQCRDVSSRARRTVGKKDNAVVETFLQLPACRTEKTSLF